MNRAQLLAWKAPVNQEEGMSGLSANVKRGEHREIVFWLLLLGSWQFLTSPGSKNGVIGAVGTAAFMLFAGASAYSDDVNRAFRRFE